MEVVQEMDREFISSEDQSIRFIEYPTGFPMKKINLIILFSTLWMLSCQTKKQFSQIETTARKELFLRDSTLAYTATEKALYSLKRELKKEVWLFEIDSTSRIKITSDNELLIEGKVSKITKLVTEESHQNEGDSTKTVEASASGKSDYKSEESNSNKTDSFKESKPDKLKIYGFLVLLILIVVALIRFILKYFKIF